MKKALLFVMLLFPLMASASVEIDGVFYELNGNIASVTVNPSGYKGNVLIPSSVLYGQREYSVSDVDSYSFANSLDLKSVNFLGDIIILDHAFEGCTNLISINLEKAIRIEESAFSGCTGLTSIYLESVGKIGDSAFEGCTGLTSIFLGYVGEIGDYAFAGCTGLISISILNNYGESINIGSQAFDNTNNCPIYMIEGTISYCKTDDNWKAYASRLLPFSVLATYNITNTSTATKILNNADGIGYVEINGSEIWQPTEYRFKNEGYVTLGIRLHSPLIYERAFEDCTALTSIVIPNGVSRIEGSAFQNCTNLTSVSIPNSVTSIEGYAFSGSGLSSVIIPDRCQTIGYCAFSSTDQLESVFIPSSVTYIDEEAFNGPTSLTSVHITDLAAWCNIDFRSESSNPLYEAHHLFMNSQEIKDLVIPNSVKSISNYAFYGCSGLTSATIPSSVTSIGSSAFDGCTDLTSITIPNSVTSIGSYAFSGCYGLTSITIPNSVTSIGIGAFCNCTDLTSITVLIKEPLSIDDITFDGSSATLYVPYGCKPAYEAADYWKEFNEIIELDPTEIPITISSAGIATYCSEYDLDFTETNVKAYIVSAFSPNTGKVILTRIYDVPAGTGIVVMGDEGEHQIPVVEAQTIVSNMLVGVTEATELNKVDGDYTNYVFAQKNGELGFYAVTDGSTLGAHKAYLPLPTAKLPSADSRVAYMFDGDDVTEIKNVGQEDKVQHSIYNLNGQRQEGLKKGLNIVDGKKMLLK